jgi:hypothetical protein
MPKATIHIFRMVGFLGIPLISAITYIPTTTHKETGPIERPIDAGWLTFRTEVGTKRNECLPI